jgi:hypothetical protein
VESSSVILGRGSIPLFLPALSAPAPVECRSGAHSPEGCPSIQILDQVLFGIRNTKHFSAIRHLSRGRMRGIGENACLRMAMLAGSIGLPVPWADRTACGACQRARPGRLLPVLRLAARLARFSGRAAHHVLGDSRCLSARRAARRSDLDAIPTACFRTVESLVGGLQNLLTIACT